MFASIKFAVLLCRSQTMKTGLLELFKSIKIIRIIKSCSSITTVVNGRPRTYCKTHGELRNFSKNRQAKRSKKSLHTRKVFSLQKCGFWTNCTHTENSQKRPCVLSNAGPNVEWEAGDQWNAHSAFVHLWTKCVHTEYGRPPGANRTLLLGVCSV